MPIIPWSLARGEVPPVGDPAYDALLDGNEPPQDVADRLGQVAEAIAALNGAPTASELAAEGSALAVFRSGGGISAEPARSARAASPWRTSLVSGKVAAAGAACVIVFSGAAAAAYAGVLPAPVQRIAHDIIGAPSPHRGTTHTHPVSPAGSATPDPTPDPGTGPSAAPTSQPTHQTGQPATHPTHPAHPTAPAHPAHPTHPSPSTHPTHPSHPPHPSPTHPPHPSGKPTNHP